MDFKVVIRKTSQGKPTWYFYTGEKYLGCLFLDEGSDNALSNIIEEGNWEGHLSYHEGPGFKQSAEQS